jgi:hypothetical protein
MLFSEGDGAEIQLHQNPDELSHDLLYVALPPSHGRQALLRWEAFVLRMSDEVVQVQELHLWMYL